jgi:uncharacterized protein (AIM24 family)
MMPGIKNALFGGDGLFLAQLTGPGRVWLQTMTLPNFAHALAPYLGQQQAQTTMDAGIGAGVAGAVLRDIFGRN